VNRPIALGVGLLIGVFVGLFVLDHLRVTVGGLTGLGVGVLAGGGIGSMVGALYEATRYGRNAGAGGRGE
jgi:hypothetical protein